jgi:MFS superfamily sulfate permease-like transporter
MWGTLMHLVGFYPLLNVKKYFEYNNIIYLFGIIALAITYFLPYWPYMVSREVVLLIIILLYFSYILYYNVLKN